MASTRREVADCLNEFTLAMNHQIAADKPAENIFLSPSNVAVVMIMIYIGARNQTEEQMAKALKLDNLERQHVLQQIERFVEKLDEGSKYFTIKAANSIFPHSDRRILDDYVVIAKEYFRTAVKPMDYTNAPDESRLQINTWVEENTNNKIKDVLPDGVVNAFTAIVVVNTIYFKGNWLVPFESNRTETKGFTKLNGDKVNVRMMRATHMEDVCYSKSRALDCKVVKLSYEDRGVGMVIVLPKENDGLPALESKHNLKTLRGLVNGLVVVNADVSLPKIKLDTSIQLKQVLSKLGMVDLFDQNKADLSGTGKDLHASEVYHKTFIDINEAGAARGARERCRCLEKIYRFNADHPFLFMIWHYRLNVPLFIGRLLEPVAVAETISGQERHRSSTRDETYEKKYKKAEA